MVVNGEIGGARKKYPKLEINTKKVQFFHVNGKHQQSRLERLDF